MPGKTISIPDALLKYPWAMLPAFAFSGALPPDEDQWAWDEELEYCMIGEVSWRTYASSLKSMQRIWNWSGYSELNARTSLAGW